MEVVNGNRKGPAYCKAVITKMERFRGEGWHPIDTSESGALSWLRGDSDGFKKVFLGSEFVNIARLPSIPKEMNLFLRQNIVFTHFSEVPHKAGKYRMLIEVQYRFETKTRIEQWFGYLDAVEITNSDKRKLTITEMEDLNEWK